MTARYSSPKKTSSSFSSLPFPPDFFQIDENFLSSSKLSSSRDELRDYLLRVFFDFFMIGFTFDFLILLLLFISCYCLTCVSF